MAYEDSSGEESGSLRGDSQAGHSYPSEALNGLEFDANTPGFASSFSANSAKEGARAKSSQRLRYEAEVSALKRRIGGLEEMRERLGLSQRKMAQLLLVDPSAWTRWTRDGEDAPPLVYRALQWFLALEDKYPALDPQFWLQAVARTGALSTEEIGETRARVAQLERQLREMQRAAQEKIARETEEKASAERLREMRGDIAGGAPAADLSPRWARAKSAPVAGVLARIEVKIAAKVAILALALLIGFFFGRWR